MPNINLSILNQKSTPAFFADTLANRPAPSFVGRVFISTDTYDLYRDTGSAWDLLSPSAAAGVTGTGVANQVAFWNGTTAITGEAKLSYDPNTDTLYVGDPIVSSGKFIVNNSGADDHIVVIGANAPSLRINNAGTGATQQIGFGISTAANNFIQGSVNGNMCVFNSNTTASPILFGIFNGTNTQEGARLSAARNFLVGQTSDTGQTLQVTGSAAITGISSFSNTGAFVGFPSVTITHGSGSGIALSITKAGNNEGLYVNKTSGSGNAATIIGTLSATTLVKSGGTSSQILAADGSVITAGTGISISAGQISATSSGGITGSGTAGYIPRFTGTSAIGNSTIRDDGSYAAIGTSPNFLYQFNFGGFSNVGITTNNIGLKFAGTGQYIDATLRGGLNNRWKFKDSSFTSGKSIITIQADSSGFSGSSLQCNNNNSDSNYKYAEFGYDAVNDVGFVDVTQNSSTNPSGLRLRTQGQNRVIIDNLFNVVIESFASSFSPVGTLYLPTIAGAPSGTPTSYSNKAPMFIDSTNNRIYVYVNSSWKYSALI